MGKRNERTRNKTLYTIKHKQQRKSRKSSTNIRNTIQTLCNETIKKRVQILQKETKINPEHIAVVGDQIFTDVLGGNRSNMFTILVDPIDSQKDYWYTAWKRPIENKIKNNYKAKEEKNKNVY